jgi:transcriptional regulator with XRE-family HTH domain
MSLPPVPRYRYTRGIPTPRIAAILRAAADEAGLDEVGLAAATGLKRRSVRRWLRGDEIPSDQDVDLFATACGCLVIDLFPVRDVVEFDPASSILRVGDHAVGIAEVSNDGVLRAYLALVREQRGLPSDAAVALRVEDIEVLASALDLDDDELEARLVLLARMTALEAQDVRARLLRSYLSHPANHPDRREP